MIITLPDELKEVVGRVVVWRAEDYQKKRYQVQKETHREKESLSYNCKNDRI